MKKNDMIYTHKKLDEIRLAFNIYYIENKIGKTKEIRKNAEDIMLNLIQNAMNKIEDDDELFKLAIGENLSEIGQKTIYKYFRKSENFSSNIENLLFKMERIINSNKEL